MDVRCARCGIEYEFDDALISDRGTMVRCTECGHQFRVHPSHVIPGAPDEWRIVTPDGQTIVYLTLRELQQGITQGQVGRDANLIRGNSPARPLGTIAELDPFFPTPAGEQRQQSTLTGVAPPSLAPTPAKPTPTGARAPIARIGLNTVQVSASGVGLEAPHLVNRPRKTTLGMGEDPQKLKEVATRARDAAQAAAKGKAPLSGDKTEVDAPVAPKPEVARGEQTAAPGKPQANPKQATAPSANAAAKPTASADVGPTITKAAPAARKSDAPPPAQQPAAQQPAVSSPKPGQAPAANTAIPKLRPKVPGAPDEPVLRADTEVSVAKKRPASTPPRPDRRNTPTPGSRLSEVTQAAAADRATAVALPLTVKSPSKPPTDPPPAVRGTFDEARFQQPSEPPEPERLQAAAPPSEPPPPHSHEILPPPSDTEPGVEESLALDFKAESPPIERPPADAVGVTPGQATPATSDEPEPGSFMPTVPPKRVLANADTLLTEETRARGVRMGRWLMAGLSIVLLSLVALWFNSRSRTPSVSPAATSGATLEHYLATAADALHAGDLVRAHDQLQSSQTLGGRDPRWITLTARYDVMRADMNWLAVRLADPNDAAHLDDLKRELADHVAQASRALASIDRLSVKDPRLGAARVDAQRLRGELEQARKGAQELRQSDPTPELAYTLAGVELLANAPNYNEVFEWLGRARAADAGLGRAPALLVIACVMSQRLECARAELVRLKSAPKSHPLLPEIEAFVNRASAPAILPESDASAPAASAAAASAIADAGTPVQASAPAAPDSSNDLTGDFRLRLRRGAESLSRNELTRAEQLFRSVLAERPTDTEALTGLGDVARRRNNTGNAINYYQKVLATNGQYLPALSALADVKWRSGDRAGAVPLYRRIIDQVGESAGYGQTAAQRLREYSEAGAKPSSAEADKAAGPAASAKSDATHRTGKQP